MFKSLLSSKKPALLTGQQIVFFAINKTGSTSLWTWMDQQRVDYLMNRYQEDEARKLQLIVELRHRHIPCFTVVRNPWERAVSSWKWCMLKKGLPLGSFADFLRIPCEQMTPQQRYHTSPQWQHVVDAGGDLAYLDHIGRLENIEDTRRWISETLGLPAGTTLPHLKKTDHDPYTQYYTPETRQLVADIFRKDIELFGYQYGA
jgi:chondroitin 4-sulfotransferase 11